MKREWYVIVVESIRRHASAILTRTNPEIPVNQDMGAIEELLHILKNALFAPSTRAETRRMVEGILKEIPIGIGNTGAQLRDCLREAIREI